MTRPIEMLQEVAQQVDEMASLQDTNARVFKNAILVYASVQEAIFSALSSIHGKVFTDAVTQQLGGGKVDEAITYADAVRMASDKGKDEGTSGKD